ncbi:MAG: hypothetical protein ACI936_002013 [Paraglaciecola sp.]|jgi:hypothetical protein
MQKPLLKVMTTQQLTLLMYIVGFCVLLPFSNMSSIDEYADDSCISLVVCCEHIIVAYGAFTYALNIWCAAKVSAVLALAFLSMLMAVEWSPQHFIASYLDNWGNIGAAMVIIGSAFKA